MHFSQYLRCLRQSLRGGREARPQQSCGLGLERLEDRTLLSAAARFDWKMQDRFGVDTNGDGRIDLANSAAFVQSPTFLVDFDAGTSTADAPITAYQWSVQGDPLLPLQVSQGARLFNP